jgi:hypothetical protein
MERVSRLGKGCGECVLDAASVYWCTMSKQPWIGWPDPARYRNNGFGFEGSSCACSSRRAIEHTYSNEDRSMTYIEGGWSRRRADSVRRLNVLGRVHDLNDPPAGKRHVAALPLPPDLLPLPLCTPPSRVWPLVPSLFAHSVPVHVFP